MQNQTKDDFSDKTDRLADALKITLKDLAGVLEISADSLFGYRTGRLRISAKAWRKLRNAEIKAGLVSGRNPAGSDRTVRGVSDANAEKDRLLSLGMVAESSSPYGEQTSWQDVEAYVRTLKLTHRGLPPDEVLELLQEKYPLSPEKKP